MKYLTVLLLSLTILGAFNFFNRSASAESISPWGSTTSYPKNVEGQSCVTYNSYIYCVGGFIGTSASDGVFYAPISSNGVGPWTQDSSHPYPISVVYPSCVVGYTHTIISTTYDIYCVGGDTSSQAMNSPTDEAWSAPIGSNLSLGSWKQLPNYQFTIEGTSCNAYEEEDMVTHVTAPSIACVGGMTTSSSVISDDVFVFDGTSWIAQPEYGSAIAFTSCVFYDSYLYCIGGETTTGPTITDSVWFAPVISGTAIGSWSGTASYPNSVAQEPCVAGADGYVYCIGGGYLLPPNFEFFLNATYYGQLSASGVSSWASGTPYPNNDSGFSCVTYSDYIYCVGGAIVYQAGNDNVYYSEIVPPQATTTITSTVTGPTTTLTGPTTTVTSTVTITTKAGPAPTTTSLSCNQVKVKSKTTCTANVTSTTTAPTGNVAFKTSVSKGGTFGKISCATMSTILQCKATFTPKKSSAQTITATYAGIANFGPSHCTFLLEPKKQSPANPSSELLAPYSISAIPTLSVYSSLLIWTFGVIGSLCIIGALVSKCSLRRFYLIGKLAEKTLMCE